MKELLRKHKASWANKEYFVSAMTGLLCLFASLVFNYFTNSYAATKQSNFVSDIILDNIPVLNVQFLVTYGAIFFIFFVVALIAEEPRRLPFIVKSVALFVVIRAVFITLTHIAPSPDVIALGDSELLKMIGMNYTSDLFFSGHAGIPFLLALTFWDSKKLRISFIIISIILAASVLLGHLHYSIDVFAAYFITHTIFTISYRLFRKDFDLMIG